MVISDRAGRMGPPARLVAAPRRSGGAKVVIDASANELCFDPEGKLLVAVTRDGLVHGWELESGQSAWAPAELEKAARWVFVQQNGQIVTCSDEITVWKRPQADKEKASPLGLAISRRTGWVYDDTARVRTLSREEYSKLKN